MMFIYIFDSILIHNFFLVDNRSRKDIFLWGPANVKGARVYKCWPVLCLPAWLRSIRALMWAEKTEVRAGLGSPLAGSEHGIGFSRSLFFKIQIQDNPTNLCNLCCFAWAPMSDHQTQRPRNQWVRIACRMGQSVFINYEPATSPND